MTHSADALASSSWKLYAGAVSADQRSVFADCIRRAYDAGRDHGRAEMMRQMDANHQAMMAKLGLLQVAHDQAMRGLHDQLSANEHEIAGLRADVHKLESEVKGYRDERRTKPTHPPGDGAP